MTYKVMELLDSHWSYRYFLKSLNVKTIYNGVVTEYGEKCSYELAEYSKIVDAIPELDELYDTAKCYSEQYFGRTLLESPWERSKINLNVMGPKDRVGLHVDSNPWTCLLFLSYGSPIKLFENGVDQRPTCIHPEPGKALLFNGKQIPHSVDSGSHNRPRVTLPFNYYYEDDCERPPWFDEYVYGNKDYKELNATSEALP